MASRTRCFESLSVHHAALPRHQCDIANNTMTDDPTNRRRRQMSNIALTSSSIQKPVPLGVESFREMCDDGYYYVDKTLSIEEILDVRIRVCSSRVREGSGKLSIWTCCRLSSRLRKTILQFISRQEDLAMRRQIYWRAGQIFRCAPVVQGPRGWTWTDALLGVQNELQDEYMRHFIRITDPKPKDSLYMERMERFIKEDLDMTQTVRALGALPAIFTPTMAFLPLCSSTNTTRR